MTRFLAVICGLKSEAGAVRSAAGGGRVRIAVSGADAARAEALAKALCSEGAAAVLSVGISGGLAPDLVPGDLIVGDCVKTKAGEEFAATPSLLTAIQLEAPGLPMRRETLFGSDEIVASPREKAALFERYAAGAVDMESHGAARAARAAGVPFAAIRAVADPASRALPGAALGAVAPDGSTRAFSVLLKCAKAPGEFPALMQLGADSDAALKTLRGGLGGLFRRLLFSLDL